MSNTATTEATTTVIKAKAKGASPEVSAPAGTTDEHKAQALLAFITNALADIDKEIVNQGGGPLALKLAADNLGKTCEKDGRPSVTAWRAFGSLVSAISPNLGLRMECANRARKAAENHLRLAEVYRNDADKLKKALDRCAKVTGKGSKVGGDAALACKFGIPDKVAMAYE